MYSIFIVAMTDQTFTTPKDAIKLLEHYQQEKATALDMYKQKMNLLRDHATTLAMQPTKRKRQQATWELLLKLVNDYTIEQQNQEDTLKRLADNNKDLWSELNHLYERFTPLEVIGDNIQSSDITLLQMEYEDQREILNKRIQTLKALNGKAEDLNHVILHHQEMLHILKDSS